VIIFIAERSSLVLQKRCQL